MQNTQITAIDEEIGLLRAKRRRINHRHANRRRRDKTTERREKGRDAMKAAILLCLADLKAELKK